MRLMPLSPSLIPLQFHIPHGVANALLISHVIRYNASDMPMKQAAFPQASWFSCCSLPRPCVIIELLTAP